MKKTTLIIENVFIWGATLGSYILQILPIFQLIAVLLAIVVSSLTAIKIIKNWNKNEKN
jgi:hypothetical protein